MGTLLNILNYPIILQLQLADDLPGICECNYIVLVQEGQHLSRSLISANQEIPYFFCGTRNFITAQLASCLISVSYHVSLFPSILFL